MSKASASAALEVPGADRKLYNHDLAPTAPPGRTWGVFSLFAMWMSDVHSVGGYTFAASLFFLGLTGWQVLASMTIGILVVYVLMNLIGRPSQRYGIPYPVVARISFGVGGANLAAVVRGRMSARPRAHIGSGCPPPDSTAGSRFHAASLLSSGTRILDDGRPSPGSPTGWAGCWSGRRPGSRRPASCRRS